MLAVAGTADLLTPYVMPSTSPCGGSVCGAIIDGGDPFNVLREDRSLQDQVVRDSGLACPYSIEVLMRKYLCSILLVLVLAAVPVSAADLPSVWAAAEVQTAIGLGLVPASLQSSYREPVTREEFRSLTMQLPGMPDSPGQSFATKEWLTRQQAAGMLYEACNNFAPWVINEDPMITTAWRGYASGDIHSWNDGAGIHSDARAGQLVLSPQCLQWTGRNTFAPENTLTRAGDPGCPSLILYE